MRPDIAAVITGAELKRWYWLKDELAAEAKRRGLKHSDGKFAILDRIAHFLDTGEKSLPTENKPAPKSKFDWHSAPLSPETQWKMAVSFWACRRMICRLKCSSRWIHQSMMCSA